jgi:hypothetical protein
MGDNELAIRCICVNGFYERERERAEEGKGTGRGAGDAMGVNFGGHRTI